MKTNNYKLEKEVERLKHGKCSRFIDPKELKDVSYLIKKSEYNIFYTYPDCDKVILYKDNMPRICLLEIMCNEKLEHREILGSLFGISVSSDFFGDIIIDNNKYYVIVLDEIKNYVIDNLFMIGNKYVEVSIADTNVISNYNRKYEEIEIIVSSLRIDTVISRLLNINRNIVKEKIQNKDVILNYNVICNYSYTLKDSDIFSIKRYGKYKYIGISNKTKKDNYIIQVYKYI